MYLIGCDIGCDFSWTQCAVHRLCKGDRRASASKPPPPPFPSYITHLLALLIKTLERERRAAFKRDSRTQNSIPFERVRSAM